MIKKKKKTVPKLKRIKRLKKEADHLWSLNVIERDRKCQIPNCDVNATVLHSHHIIGRSNLATRWDTLNGITLCFTHHRKAHDDPESIRDQIINHVGAERYSELKQKANQIVTNLTERDLITIIESLKRET